MSEQDLKSNTKSPLSSLKIISFEQYGAGPWGTMHLADMGAEIIKVEDPSTGGDIARHVPPYTSGDDSLYFQSFNRNKKSITLDMRHEESVSILHRLVKSVDGVFNNLRGDIPSKLGLDYESLGPVNPSIVCCSLSAFGNTGSRSSEPGYDYVMQAYAGWMSITGDPESPPQKAGLSLVDYSAGVLASLGMMGAIFRARESGIGCNVELSLFDNAISHLSYIGTWALTSGYEPRRWPDSAHPSQVPSQSLPTSDGWIVVMCAKEHFFRELLDVLGLTKLENDSRFQSFSGRLENRQELSSILKEVTVTKTTSEWINLMKGRVPCGPVNTVQQALADHQVEEDDMIIESEHPTLGSVRHIAGPIKFRDGITYTHTSSPSLGEHTSQVLRDYAEATGDEINEWKSRGLI